MNYKREEELSLSWIILTSSFFTLYNLQEPTPYGLTVFLLTASSGILAIFLSRFIRLPLSYLVVTLYNSLRSKKNKKIDEVFLLLSILSALPDELDNEKLKNHVLHAKVRTIYPTVALRKTTKHLTYYAVAWFLIAAGMLYFEIYLTGIVTVVAGYLVFGVFGAVAINVVLVYLRISSKWTANPSTILAICAEQNKLTDLRADYKNIRLLIALCEHFVTSPTSVRIYEMLIKNNPDAASMDVKRLQFIANFLKEPTLPSFFETNLDLLPAKVDTLKLLNLFKKYPVASIDLLNNETQQ